MSDYIGNEPVTITNMEETAYAMTIELHEQERSDLIAVIREMWVRVIRYKTGHMYTENIARGESTTRGQLELLLDNPDLLEPTTDPRKWDAFEGVARVFLYTK